jgi:hypothetical protein
VGKHKKKQHQKQAKQRRDEKRKRRNARKPERRGPGAMQPQIVARLPPIDPPEPQRCLPAVTLDATGKSVDDPYALLGVTRDADEPAIMAAWRARIVECPPERDPEGARRLLEARQRLLDPARVIERELGALHVPDPDQFGLPAPETGVMLSARDRLVGQLALYALLEATGSP